ncbi:DUF281 domain-containing protein [Caenorhabditis elegans]|uniref:DUF281 domain-containing protein n=1 Tax=Caenorhabditis elegans TaxID=6239 RepID=D5MCR8_CAEEL|nr:DUF281 domain-containing protein [Caenorhabditis elegans]CBL43417.1 DUF281 domain-containing protein [Caenorhabditis elegans]|eukprot:NP_001256223.1 Uncharacterized protein CELE_C35A5.11 [Caenorhabditis elegans]
MISSQIKNCSVLQEDSLNILNLFSFNYFLVSAFKVKHNIFIKRFLIYEVY